MKNKKFILLVSLTALMGLASCGGTGEEGGNSASQMSDNEWKSKISALTNAKCDHLKVTKVVSDGTSGNITLNILFDKDAQAVHVETPEGDQKGEIYYAFNESNPTIYIKSNDSWTKTESTVYESFDSAASALSEFSTISLTLAAFSPSLSVFTVDGNSSIYTFSFSAGGISASYVAVFENDELVRYETEAGGVKTIISYDYNVSDRITLPTVSSGTPTTNNSKMSKEEWDAYFNPDFSSSKFDHIKMVSANTDGEQSSESELIIDREANAIRMSSSSGYISYCCFAEDGAYYISSDDGGETFKKGGTNSQTFNEAIDENMGFETFRSIGYENFTYDDSDNSYSGTMKNEYDSTNYQYKIFFKDGEISTIEITITQDGTDNTATACMTYTFNCDERLTIPEYNEDTSDPKDPLPSDSGKMSEEEWNAYFNPDFSSSKFDHIKMASAYTDGQQSSESELIIDREANAIRRSYSSGYISYCCFDEDVAYHIYSDDGGETFKRRGTYSQTFNEAIDDNMGFETFRSIGYENFTYDDSDNSYSGTMKNEYDSTNYQWKIFFKDGEISTIEATITQDGTDNTATVSMTYTFNCDERLTIPSYTE